LNHTFRADLKYNPLPTMLMDWTEDYDTAKEFALSNGDEGLICAIDYNFYKDKTVHEFGGDVGIHDFDFARQNVFYDYHNMWTKFNVNMQKQKGIVLFWPWEYSISELSKNELGKQLGFAAFDIKATT